MIGHGHRGRQSQFAQQRDVVSRRVVRNGRNAAGNRQAGPLALLGAIDAALRDALQAEAAPVEHPDLGPDLKPIKMIVRVDRFGQRRGQRRRASDAVAVEKFDPTEPDQRHEPIAARAAEIGLGAVEPRPVRELGVGHR